MALIGVDVGGTFTDLCLYDDQKETVSAVKTPTTPHDPAIGVRKGLALLPLAAPEQVRLIQHGSTIVTNALLERRGALIGLITTAGFRDVLEIMRTDRERLYDLRWRRPAPLVPRDLRTEVVERIGPAGDVLVPLDEPSVHAAADELVEAGCEAIAVALLHSYANPVHERRVAELIAARHPEVPVYASSVVDGQYREYERTATTVLTAFVGPVVDRYVTSLCAGLEEDGFDPRCLNVMQSNGGSMKPEHARSRAGFMFASGPAGGVVGAIETARLAGFDRVLTMDMGGTSTDVSLAEDGRARLKAAHEIEFGIPLRAPSIDIVSIGAGGGSIAAVDPGGRLQVGPRSAGAVPGPACYGRGGTLPTVTDANVVLRRISGGIGSGSVSIDPEAAANAIGEHIAKPLGLDTVDAALGIVRIAGAMMANAIREVSVARGEDPRAFALVAFGGAGPLHAADVAAELEIPTILVPATPGVLSALGCMISDVRFDVIRSARCLADDDGLDRIKAIVDELETDGRRLLREEGFTDERQLRQASADMRYAGQVHEVAVDLPLPISELSRDGLVALFEEAHERLYGAPFPGHAIEVVNVRLASIGIVEKPRLRAQSGSEALAPSTGEREIVFTDGPLEAAVYRRTLLEPGHRIVGPAVVESDDSTVLVPAGWSAHVDDYRSLVMQEVSQ